MAKVIPCNAFLLGPVAQAFANPCFLIGMQKLIANCEIAIQVFGKFAYPTYLQHFIGPQ